MKARTLFLCAATLSATLAASGASVPRMSFERIVRNSPRAFHGVVERSWSAWDDSHAAIWTHYEIRVSEALRGPAEATFTISEPGGEVGEIAMRVPGAPRLDVGEEVVVFAYPTPLGYWRVRGWGQGLFRVEERDGRRTVRPPQSEALLLDVRTIAAKETPLRESLVEGGLDAFLERVRALVREDEGR